MQDFHPFSSASSQKPNYIYIHQSHLVQIQRDPWSRTRYLFLQYLQMLRPNSAYQTDSCASLVRIALHPQCHLLFLRSAALLSSAMREPFPIG